MPIIFYALIIPYFILVIADIVSYYSFKKENEKLKKQLEKKENEISCFKTEIEKLRHLIKYYANRDKKGF